MAVTAGLDKLKKEGVSSSGVKVRPALCLSGVVAEVAG